MQAETKHTSNTNTAKSDSSRLPAGVKLYLREGIPQLFRAVTSDIDSCQWLYIPESHLETLVAVETVPCGNSAEYQVGINGLELDEEKLYPIKLSRKIIAIAQLPADSEPGKIDFVPHLPAEPIEREGRSSELAGIFVKALFQKDNNLATVLRKSLDLIAGQCDGSYVGLYHIAPSGEWVLRMAVGDIHLSDRLPNRPSGTKMKEWSRYASEGGRLVASDSAPDFPVIFSHAPTFLQIAPGPISYHSEFVIVTAIPGTASIEEVAAVRSSSSLLRYLDETQFTSTNNLLGLFSELTEVSPDEEHLASQLTELFRILDQELTIERLALINAREPAIVVFRDEDRKVQTIECANYHIATDLWSFTKEQPLGITCGDGHAIESIETRYGNVAVERTFRIQGPKESDFLFAIGTTHDSSQLEKTTRVLMTATRYMTLLLREIYGDNSSGNALIVSRVGENPERVIERVQILRKLSDGMFHGLFGSMSVVVGQSELLAGMAAADSGSNRQLETIPKIVDAANETAERLTRLRKIFGYDQIASSAVLTATDLVVELPGLLEGFLRKIKDMRSITVTLEFDSYSDSDYSTTSDAAIEYILKFVAMVMEEAICSGNLAVRFDDARALSIQVPRAMIEHIEAVDLLQQLYPYDRFDPDGDSGAIESEKMRVSIDQSDDGYVCFMFENRRLIGRKFDKDGELELSGESD